MKTRAGALKGLRHAVFCRENEGRRSFYPGGRFVKGDLILHAGAASPYDVRGGSNDAAMRKKRAAEGVGPYYLVTINTLHHDQRDVN